jgi:hypothetical protein
MTRNDLINRLVARKMEANRPVKAFCFYMASPARKLCWVATNQPAAANPKS